MFRSLILVDPLPRRRSNIYQDLSQFIRVEPVDSVKDIGLCWPDPETFILAYDDQHILDELMQVFLERGTWLSYAVYATDLNPARVVDVVQAGSLAYLLHPFDAEQVTRQLAQVYEKSMDANDRRRKRMEARSLVGRLTPRELQVAEELSAGASNKEIARHLNISPRTVEIHRSNLLKKLSARSSAQAIRVLAEAA